MRKPFDEAKICQAAYVYKQSTGSVAELLLPSLKLCVITDLQLPINTSETLPNRRHGIGNIRI